MKSLLNPMTLCLVSLLALFVAGCSSDAAPKDTNTVPPQDVIISTQDVTDTSQDLTPPQDTQPPTPDAAPDVPAPEPDVTTPEDTAAQLYPAIPQSLPEVSHAGVVYLSHYHTNDLRIYRVDGAQIRQLDSYDMNAPGDGLAMDPDNDLMFVAKFINKTVEIMQLDRPTSPEDELEPPQNVHTMNYTDLPLMIRHDRGLNRLYVFTAPPIVPGQLLSEMKVYVYDVQDPANPVQLNATPHSVPVTTSVAIDPVRQILFLYESNGATDAKMLHAYDLLSQDLEEIPGSPLDLKVLFPQTNNTGMSFRGLQVLEEEHRLYAARAQGANSELVVFDYPGAFPTTDKRYGELVDFSETIVVPDFFDIDVPVADRPNLLDAYGPQVDHKLRAIFLPADAWASEISFSSAIVVPMTSASQVAPACGDFEGFGCFYRSYFNNVASSYAATDEASCVNSTHRVYIGTSFDAINEEDQGSVNAYKYDADLSMTPFLQEGGKNPSAGGLPIQAICH